MPNIYTKGYESLGEDINKQKQTETPENQEGIISDKLVELDLSMSDEKIIKLTNNWEKAWKDSPVKSEWEKQYKDNEDYWLGKQFDKPQADKSRSMVDNLIFESVETYLPQATRRNPEPLITLHSSEESTTVKEDYVTKVKTRLADIADENKLRLKVKKVARHWSLYLLGVGKYGWDLDKDMPSLKIVRPQKIILDPEAVIDEDGYSGNRIGEYRRMEVSMLLNLVDDGVKKFLKEEVDKKEGTMIQFIEWWTPQYFCWKYKNKILLKKKNPHWNYDEDVEKTKVDDYGIETKVKEPKEGINHLPVPRMPYTFLTVFNLGNQPMDNTSLIGQNLANQDLINKRNKQIDSNADSMNNGLVISAGRAGLTKQQAAQANRTLRKGGTIVLPQGSPRDAIERFPTPGLPGDIYAQLQDTRARLRDIFGVKGSSQAGLNDEKTVRGKMLSKSLDTDRIGGGVTEYLEQFADEVYNWFVQLLYVYDTAFQFIGEKKPPKLNVSVKEGSLLPKDSVFIAEQSMQLAQMGKISNIDLFKRLEYPNPEELAANVWLEQNAPHLLFKENKLVQEAMGMLQQNAQAQQEGDIAAKEKEAEIEITKEAAKQELQARANVAEQAAGEAAQVLI